MRTHQLAHDPINAFRQPENKGGWTTALLFVSLAVITPLAQAAAPITTPDTVLLDSCTTPAPSVAKLFTYEDKGSYMKVTSKQCDETYILYRSAEKKPDLGPDYKYFTVPLKKVAVTQRVTNTFLEALNVRDKIVMAPKHTTSACLAKRVADGAMKDCGDCVDSSAKEQGIDAIFADPSDASTWEKKDASSSPKVICAASIREESPLAAAEWIKFYAYFFDVTATDAYCNTWSRYQCNSIAANNKKLGPVQTPKIMFVSEDGQGNFGIDAPATKNQLIIDAGGMYPDLSSFKNFQKADKSGFTFPGASKEKFHNALRMADVLIHESNTYGQTLTTITDKYSLPAVKVGQAFLINGDDPAGQASGGNTGWALVSHGIGEKLYSINDAGVLVTQLASAMPVKNSDGSWIVTLAAGRKFSDGTPVTASDVKTALSRTNQFNSAAKTLGTMTFEAQGDLTLKITTQNPTPVLANILTEWWAVVYKTVNTASSCTSNPAVGVRDPVPVCRIFTGPYEIKRLKTTTTSSGTTGNELDMIPNAFHPGPDVKQRVPITIKKFSGGSDVASALERGEIDMGFNLPKTAASSLNWVPNLAVKSFAVGYQYNLFFNTKGQGSTGPLADVNVRKAIALGIDRQKLAQAAAPEGTPASTVAKAVATSAFPSNTPWGAAHQPLPTDTTQAATMLDAAGWTLVNNVRTKAGVQLTLNLVYYTFRSDFILFAPEIKKQLEALGITVTVTVNDSPDSTDGFYAGTGFDMLLWAQHTLPGGDPAWFLETFFRSTTVKPAGWSGGNFAQHSSTTIDAELDTLRTAQPGTARENAGKAAMLAILNEVPATFISSPTWHVGVSNRNGMTTYEPWGSDYHVIKETMPASDWPTAIINERVYTLDGAKADGATASGLDWDESRFAEPDAMIHDLIAVLHPVDNDYAPTGLHYLRHAASGTSPRLVKATDCADAAATRPIRAATCKTLGITKSELVVKSLKTDEGNSNDGLKVATAVLAVVSFVSIMAIVVYYFRFYNRANATIPPQHEAKSTPSAPPDSNVIQVPAGSSQGVFAYPTNAPTGMGGA